MNACVSVLIHLNEFSALSLSFIVRRFSHFAHIHAYSYIKRWNKAFVFLVTKRNNPMRNKTFAMALWFWFCSLPHTVHLTYALFISIVWPERNHVTNETASQSELILTQQESLHIYIQLHRSSASIELQLICLTVLWKDI